MVIQFHERDNSVSFIRNGGCKPIYPPDDVIAHIKNDMGEVQFLSLHERVELIKERFGFQMSIAWLSKTYKRMGVIYSQSKTVYRKAKTKSNQLEQERKTTAKQLASLLL